VRSHPTIQKKYEAKTGLELVIVPKHSSWKKPGQLLTPDGTQAEGPDTGADDKNRKRRLGPSFFVFLSLLFLPFSHPFPHLPL